MSGCVAGGAAIIIFMAARRHNEVLANVTPTVTSSTASVASASDPNIGTAIAFFIALVFFLGVILNDGD